MDKQATKIYDALRYTAYIKNPDQFVNSYNTIKLNLKKMGYDIVRVKNTINKYTIKNPYRGVNVVVQTKQGYKFELQFHTPKSLEIKEVNHMLYKQVSSTNSQARKINYILKCITILSSCKT